MSHPNSTLKAQVKQLPQHPGVYLWKSNEDILYVGKAKNLRSRANSYLLNKDEKSVRIRQQATSIEFMAVRNEKEALVLEHTLIKRHRPPFNVRLTDGRNYPFIKLTKGPWPRLMKVHEFKDDGGTYFGPFPDGYGAFHVMQILGDLFPLRRCKTVPTEKCLYFDIKKCLGPCIDACSKDEYQVVVDDIKRLLKGDAKPLMRRLRSDLEEAAQASRFEDAARLRDQLRGLEGVLERQHMLRTNTEDRDVAVLVSEGDEGVAVLLHQRDGKVVGQSPFVLRGLQGEDEEDALSQFLVGHYQSRSTPRYLTAPLPTKAAALEADLRALSGHAVTVESPQKGDKTRWLEVARTNAQLRFVQEKEQRLRRGMGAVEALQELLGLPNPPRVIDGIDISHQGGQFTRAALVRFVEGEPDKSQYRIFGMKEVGEGSVTRKGRGREVDDFASIHEAVKRRMTKLPQEDWPDLLLIDGGKGQLGAALEALEEVGVSVPIVSLAKQEEELFLPKRLESVRAKRDHPGLQLAQRVRDESHRFGITQVRRKAKSAVTRSPLDTVPGIGPKRRHALLLAFGGLSGLQAASQQELQMVPGMSAQLARDVHKALERAATK